jgi:anion transporter
LKPFQPDLEPQGHYVLMMFLITIGLWIFKPFGVPFSVSSVLFAAFLLVLGLSPNIIFSGFSGLALWTLIPALFFGFVLEKTGLGKRIAYLGMKNTKLSYGGLLFMWVVIGIILSALTPSIAVRVVIVTPIALNCVNICKLPNGSKGRSLILLTAWSMALIPGAGWMTGSLVGPILNGFFSTVPELGPISFSQWAKVSLLPISIITILTVIGGYFALKPSEPLRLTKDTFIDEYRKLGRISRQEVLSSIILVASFLMFVTNPLHHIPDAAICLIALFLLGASGIIESKDVGAGINWDLVVFVGIAMSLNSIFTQSGVALWISSFLVPALGPISGNPWIFVYVTLIVMFLWRFIDIAIFIPTMAILSSVIPHISAAYGINPLVWIPLISIALNAFFMSYQNMFGLVAETNLGKQGWSSKHLGIYGTTYFIASLVSMLAAVPYWILIGIL